MNHRDEQAAEWCLRLAEGPFDAQAQREFFNWHNDELNRAALEQAIAAWQGIQQVADQPEIIRARAQALESYRRANLRRWTRRPTLVKWLAACAAVLLLVFGGFQFFGRPAVQHYQTGIGERRLVVLTDGTHLSLDAATRIDVKFQGSRRSLSLIAGRAKFDVAKDPLRPFSVTAGTKVVVATGTSFSVELLDKQMRVLLYEGHVEVLEQARPLGQELLPGRELLLSLDRAGATVAAIDIPRSLTWETGQLDFQNEPLALAVERMNRYSREPLVIQDARAADLRINGVFNAGDTQAFIEGMRSFLPLKITRTEGRLMITMTEAATSGER